MEAKDRYKGKISRERKKKRVWEKVNLISPGKLDSPAFSNSCFRATASMGRWRG